MIGMTKMHGLGIVRKWLGATITTTGTKRQILTNRHFVPTARLV